MVFKLCSISVVKVAIPLLTSYIASVTGNAFLLSTNNSFTNSFVMLSLKSEVTTLLIDWLSATEIEAFGSEL